MCNKRRYDIDDNLRDKVWNIACVKCAVNEIDKIRDNDFDSWLTGDYLCVKYYLKRLLEKLKDEELD